MINRTGKNKNNRSNQNGQSVAKGGALIADKSRHFAAQRPAFFEKKASPTYKKRVRNGKYFHHKLKKGRTQAIGNQRPRRTEAGRHLDHEAGTDGPACTDETESPVPQIFRKEIYGGRVFLWRPGPDGRNQRASPL